VTPALELRNISKRFGAVEALTNVDFALQRGEIHALLGENGAGKSTLTNTAFGLVRLDAGSILIDGVPRRLRNPVEARALGIGMVHQHFTSIPRLTVMENVALAAGWPLQRERIGARLRALAANTGLDLDPDADVENLSAGLKQRLEVLKALATDARILLLDEPSSVLPPTDADSFLALLRTLRDNGVASVLITHKLSEALSIADRVTVLRRGRVVHSGPIGGETAGSLAAHMLGESPVSRPAIHRQPRDEITIEASGLALPRLGTSGSGLREASFVVHAGELVGVAAVEGNGQRELLRAVAGLAVPTSGTLKVAAPVSFIPEDRTIEGLITEFSLTENLVLAQGRSAPWVTGPWVDWERARIRTRELIEAYGVNTSGTEATAGSLSGGNQQRLIIASALERRPAVLVAENPTRGLDLRATEEVHQRLRALAEGGVSVVVHLGDLDELLGLVDRVLVLSNGVALEMPAGSTRNDVGRSLLGAGVA
jgi:general nucleoside transport system ATP-binding protein